MKGISSSQAALFAGLVVGLAAFWAAGAPLSPLDASVFGGWREWLDNNNVLVPIAYDVGSREFLGWDYQACESDQDNTCYGGYVAAAIPTWTGYQYKHTNNLVSCTSGYCHRFVYEGTMY